MAERQIELDPPVARYLRGAAVQDEARWPVATARDLRLPRGEVGELQRFERRLLGGEARRKMPARSRGGTAVGELGRSEQALGEPRPALERALHPLDLDQVHADHRDTKVSQLTRPPPEGEARGDGRNVRYYSFPTASRAIARSPSTRLPAIR